MQLTGCIHVGAAGAVLSGACQAQDAIAIAVHQNRVGMSDLEALVELQSTSTRSLGTVSALSVAERLAPCSGEWQRLSVPEKVNHSSARSVVRLSVCQCNQ